jgi:hypothetical protein
MSTHAQAFWVVLAALLILTAGHLLWRARGKAWDAKDSLDSTKTAVEVIAICLAGWFAYTRFVLTEEPTLRTNLETSMDVARSDTFDSDSTRCIVNVPTKVRNRGKGLIRMDSVEHRLWVVPDAQLLTTDGDGFVTSRLSSDA